MAVPAYETDPAEIYRQSFSTIRAEADLSRFAGGMEAIAVRLIHACGMVDIVEDIDFSADAFDVGAAALKRGAPIFCDVEMVRHGIIQRRLPVQNRVVCTLNDDRTPVLAKSLNTTRSAAQVELWQESIEGSIVAIGNAPTTLFRLLEKLDAGWPRPALIIGIPVGFVGAAESKAALSSDARGVPHIAVMGRRGGSAMASAVVNALAADETHHG